MLDNYPALFPKTIEQGYVLPDILPASAKLTDVRYRCIKLKAGEQQVVALSTRDVKGYKDHYELIQSKVWDMYPADNRRECVRQVVNFQQCTAQNLAGPAQDTVHILCANADVFFLTFGNPPAYGTSVMIDRHVVPLARWFAAFRSFRGLWCSAELHIRSWVLLHNFQPPLSQGQSLRTRISPSRRLCLSRELASQSAHSDFLHWP